MATRHCDISISGYASRVPGANSAEQFWSNLTNEVCSVTSITEDRFPLSRYGHPDRNVSGKSYTWAAGVIDNVWSFDPTFFGISPREAVQMDPQQRILLEVVWEALEHAGIRPSELAGTDAGVFVGASSLDYHHRFVFDPSALDMQMMTGNTLSIISNRISYIYDLRGPSFTVDTACSSSLVALHEAINAVESGQVETAIVAGVNMLLSPLSYLGFSRASMLSKQGLCRAFDADGDGYVRSEGAVAFVLRRSDIARAKGDTIHARILASGLNADGRTVGMSLPSSDAQGQLLRDIYEGLGIDPADLAFVEAHGTGTRVGDPAEAGALGSIVARRRTAPLPIGSVKTNVGHLESASGAVGLLKALLSLKKDFFPRSLHFDTPNPDIDFGDLNLKVAGEAVKLEKSDRPRLAGINSFGFGGTNAHVVIADGETTTAPDSDAPANAPLVLSARSADSLVRLAGAYRQRLSEAKGDEPAAAVLSAAAHRRDWLDHRLVVLGETPEQKAAALGAYLANEPHEDIITGRAPAGGGKLAFLFSGNGSQWAGMGRQAFEQDEAFRKAFGEVDAAFSAISGWSLEEMLFSPSLEQEIERAEISQPLLFGVQAALTQSLREKGIAPQAVAGHSVGEVAAAWAADALTLTQAVQVIYARSRYQEQVRGQGTMAALLLSEEESQAAIQESGLDGIEIAAVNSRRSVTISGPTASIDAFAKFARSKRWALRKLGIAYPFHSQLIDPIELPLKQALSDLTPAAPAIPFVSSVDPEQDAIIADGTYWWRNVRQPVRFADAVAKLIELGSTVFVEIGPRPVLTTYASDMVRENSGSGLVLASLDNSKSHQRSDNPVAAIAATIVANGGAVDIARFVGSVGRPLPDLPAYPWQMQDFRPEETDENTQAMFARSWPLLGNRLSASSSEWFNHCDAKLNPFLGDHRVEDSVVFPAAGFAEMALRAVSEWTDCDAVELRDVEILRPLVLDGSDIQETMVRVSADDRVVEIFSRPRLKGADWSLNVRGHFITPSKIRQREALDAGASASSVTIDAEELYRLTREHGLNYGPAFRRAKSVERIDERTARVALEPRHADIGSTRFSLCPTLLDSGFHGLFALLGDKSGDNGKRSFLPVRIGRLQLAATGKDPAFVDIRITKASPRSVEASFDLLDADGALVARLTGARFKAVQLSVPLQRDSLVYRTYARLLPDRQAPSAVDAVLGNDVASLALKSGVISADEAEPEDAALLIEALARSVAHQTIATLADAGEFDPDRAMSTGGLHESARPLVGALLNWLLDADFVEETESGWKVTDPNEQPSPAAILSAVMEQAPEHIAVASLLARLAEELPGILRTGLSESASSLFSSSLLEATLIASPEARASDNGVEAFATTLIDGWPEGKTLSILLVGATRQNLARALQAKLDPHYAALAVTDTHEATLQRAKSQQQKDDAIRFVDFDEEALEAEGPFDMVLSSSGLSDCSQEDLALLRGQLRTGGLLMAIEPLPSLASDLVRGVGRDWWTKGAGGEFALSCLKFEDEWQSELERSGFDNCTTFPFASSTVEASVLTARAGGRETQAENVAAAQPAISPSLLVIADDLLQTRRHLEHLLPALEAEGIGAIRISFGEQTRLDTAGNGTIDPIGDRDRLKALIGQCASGIIHLDGAYNEDGNDQDAVDTRLWSLTRLLKAIGGDTARLWVVAPGAAQDFARDDVEGSPRQAAAWAYGRVAMNEYSDVDLRLVDVSPDLAPKDAALRLAAEIAAPGEEREVVIASDGNRYGLRIQRGALLSETPENLTGDVALRLDIRRQGSLDELRWQPVVRPAPEGSEVEIAVEASGLNFRDVMWALGLLPEEALEDGFAGPTLGMECAGRVVRTGGAVSRFKVGDRVMTFAPACLASHVTVDESACAAVPDAMPSAAAATVPVTFLTAYYALVHLAHIERGETVLIHGGAGGIGLAALQIAKWRGAVVIATAGSPEKRAMLRLAGADQVLDSRSLDFVEEVMDLTGGEGVDAVLNSLFGEAMQRSIDVLKPFGRFLELGKRDFYANTHIGLRPFRQNLSYFGIDADQLLTRQKPLAEQLFREIVGHFEKGTFKALPHRRFAAADVVQAFRLMQQAGHIGKIVLEAPAVSATAEQPRNLNLDSEATYLIAGGFGGFGAELLSRLADRGARTLLVLSRRGGESDDAKAVIERLGARGVRVEARACDIADEIQLRRVLKEARKTLPPIVGVFHTAMVLNDTLIANLDEDGISRVLLPKVRGAELLDRLTAEDPIEHFVLYSSATTLVGNPGQANYVAANGYLEALARRRRTNGKPGLAIAWGAISDAGYLARNTDVNDILSKRLGGQGLSARDALDGLVSLLEAAPAGVENAAIGYARIDWQGASRDLKIVGTPLAAGLGGGNGEATEVSGDALDLAAMLKGLDRTRATKTVADILAREIGKILRISSEEIDPQRPLADVGMDSLMALELRMNAERLLGVDIPLMALANGASLNDMAGRIAARVLGEASASTISAPVQTLAAQHLDMDGIEESDLANMARAAEAKANEMRSIV
ncbi:SDR family NAD(P)-dependent oxidoreductase [Stappia sp. F7233]|uniref:SDR family NAD(P)-dependent oxidoreductase n=1 Tax=Stappia albiluteola TaxID=2758565 RepID=A0A839AA58_9HYPH|nr:type I polyketide synthase [Stappia albiluteola]MBA5775807.1 SDR family NAD(P)-dependent oxidoreductase [Stappia albiluteola]